MDKDFYNDDLDDFLQQKADEYTMYPSEKVWKKVRRNLFWHKNWYSVTGGILALFLLFLLPESFLSTIFPDPPKTNSNATKETGAANALSAPSADKLKAIPGNLPATAASNTPQASKPVLFVAKSTPLENSTPVHISELPVAKTGHQPAAIRPNSQSIIIAAPAVTEGSALVEEAEKESKATDEKEVKADVNLEEAPTQYHGDVNWLQEMALINLTPKKQGKFNLQFYFSPLVSYRTLTDNGHNTHTANGNAPLAGNQVDINQYVDHQPSMGVELGSNILYRASNRLTIRTGLQLNYSRYTIKAYRAGYEKASIALKSFGRPDDTLTTYTTIRNFNGYLQEQLQNQYFQVSLPVGAELKLLGNKRFQINVAGTIQPTYLLLSDTYLLSTNYINYIKEPSLVRRWNVHSSAEAYISYQFANVRWQVGPQFRYQLLSSFNDRYPVKEYLMEYGIKFGISKTLK
ncbi:MAG: hypothetical protein INR73_15190 [Williamsia sp.]|nr:hypothetical protein [Williamsia sp.]